MRLERPIQDKEMQSRQVICMVCFQPFWPAKGTERETCPTCGMEWRVSWLNPQTARIRGPVWEKYPK